MSSVAERPSHQKKSKQHSNNTKVDTQAFPEAATQHNASFTDHFVSKEAPTKATEKPDNKVIQDSPAEPVKENESEELLKFRAALKQEIKRLEQEDIEKKLTAVAKLQEKQRAKSTFPHDLSKQQQRLEDVVRSPDSEIKKGMIESNAALMVEMMEAAEKYIAANKFAILPAQESKLKSTKDKLKNLHEADTGTQVDTLDKTLRAAQFLERGVTRIQEKKSGRAV